MILVVLVVGRLLAGLLLVGFGGIDVESALQDFDLRLQLCLE